MTTEFTWLEIWPIWLANCLVMLRKGTATAIESGRPESDGLGMPVTRKTPLATATIT